MEEGFTSRLLRSIKKGGPNILLNGKPCYMESRVKTGDIITVQVKEKNPSGKLLPLYYPIEILYEDEDVLAVNKPPNMPVHPSFGHYEDTLANVMAGYFWGEAYVFYGINRLDRDTSGVVLVAKNPYSASILSQSMKDSGIQKQYYAIAEGVPPKEGMIRAPIAREEGSIIKRQVSFEHGERAETQFWREKTNGTLSLVRLKLITGRTHQIRVHMSYMGWPVLGDSLYGAQSEGIGRQALHCWQMTWNHPVEKKEVTITAPLPKDMRQCLDKVGMKC